MYTNIRRNDVSAITWLMSGIEIEREREREREMKR